MRPVLEVADIFRSHGDAFRIAQGDRLSHAQRRVMSAIERCRTAALGGHVAQCEDCATPFASPTIVAAIGIARSARAPRPRMAGRTRSRVAAGAVLSCRIHAAGSHRRHRAIRTRPWSTTCCSRRRPRPCSRSRPIPTSRRPHWHHRGAAYLGLGAHLEPSLKIPGIIISLIFSEQCKLVSRATPLQN